MKTAYLEDNLEEMSNLKKYEKRLQNVICWNFSQHAKR